MSKKAPPTKTPTAAEGVAALARRLADLEARVAALEQLPAAPAEPALPEGAGTGSDIPPQPQNQE